MARFLRDGDSGIHSHFPREVFRPSDPATLHLCRGGSFYSLGAAISVSKRLGVQSGNGSASSGKKVRIVKAFRIFLRQWDLSPVARTFVIKGCPAVHKLRVGDKTVLDGFEFTVSAIEPTEILACIPFPVTSAAPAAGRGSNKKKKNNA